MTVRRFVDTNVWVYAVDGADPAKQAAATAALEPSRGVQVVLSAQVLGEFYTTVTRKLQRPLTPALAAAMVDRMRRLPTVAIDGDVVAAAVAGAQAWRISYWDALIVASAAASGCGTILTEDLADGGSYGGVRVQNPFTAHRRLSETTTPYAPTARSWDEPGLQAALDHYAAACRDGGMRSSAVHSYRDHARRFLDWRTGAYRPRGATSGPRPMSETAATVDALVAQVDAYVGAITSAGLGPASVDAYRRHAMFFVRWLAGDFHPGARLANR
jgi:predicted nucleic acid-binding protein